MAIVVDEFQFEYDDEYDKTYVIDTDDPGIFKALTDAAENEMEIVYSNYSVNKDDRTCELKFKMARKPRIQGTMHRSKE